MLPSMSFAESNFSSETPIITEESETGNMAEENEGEFESLPEESPLPEDQDLLDDEEYALQKAFLEPLEEGDPELDLIVDGKAESY